MKAVHYIWREIRIINEHAEIVNDPYLQRTSRNKVCSVDYKDLKESNYDFVGGQFLMEFSSSFQPQFIDKRYFGKHKGGITILLLILLWILKKLMIEIPEPLLKCNCSRNSQSINLLLPLELVRLYLNNICSHLNQKFIAFTAFRNADIDFEYDNLILE